MPDQSGVFGISPFGDCKKPLAKGIGIYSDFWNGWLGARRHIYRDRLTYISNVVFCSRLAAFSLAQLHDIDSLQYAAGFFQCAVDTFYWIYFWPVDLPWVCEAGPGAIFIKPLGSSVSRRRLDAVDDFISPSGDTKDILGTTSRSSDKLAGLMNVQMSPTQ